MRVAVGRGPNSAGYGYDEVGVRLDRGFVVTDERLQTSVPGIYALGDLVPGLQLAHRGFQQGIFIAEELTGRNPQPIDESGIPRVTYCEPEVASVGLTEAQAREAGHDVGVGRHELVRRSSYIDARHGLFKVVYDRAEGTLLGLHVVSRNAGEVVQGFSLGLRLGATVDELTKMHHVFPTFGEGVKAAAEQAVGSSMAMD